MLVGIASAVRMPPLETVLPAVSARTTVALAEHDALTTAAWAQVLARIAERPLLRLAGASHSWPVDDQVGFADRVDTLLEESP